MKTKLYDINISVDDTNTLYLTAYELMVAERNEVVAVSYTTNTDKYHTLTIPMNDENYWNVAYLLDSDRWAEEDWEEYDFWHTTEYLKEGETPALIKSWVDSLPEYEIL